MIKMRLWMLLGLLLVIGIPACQKRTNLVDKAFKDKDFEHRIGEQDQDVEVPDDDKGDDEQESSVVLVDNLQTPKGETEFLTTDKEDRTEFPKDRLIKKNPSAPILNFEDAKLYDIVHSLCQVMEVNFIIDPSVKDQTVTIGMIEGDQKMTTLELFDLVLKLHNLAFVASESFIRIVPIDSPDIMPGIELLHGTIPNPNLMTEELAIQIVPLRYTTPTDITSVIKEFLSPSARIMEEPINNLLIIMDKYNFIEKAMEVVPIFDINVLQNKKMVLYNLKHVDAVETATQLQEILIAYGLDGDERVKFFPVITLNAVMVVSSMQEVFEEIQFWVDRLDKEAQFEEPQIFVYQVQNTTADIISGTLSQIYGFRGGGIGGRGSAGASQRRSTSPNQNPNDQNNRTQDARQQTQLGNENPALQNLPGADAARNMIVDADNNSLIFNTTPREYSKILKTLHKLDILPRQVFMEVTVLNISLKDGFNLGFNWNISDMEGGEANEPGRTRSFSYTPEGNAFSYSYTALTKSVVAAVNAAQNKGYANVLQQPHIMALDNKQASISIGDDIPIVSSNINIPGVGQSDQVVTSSNVQYRKTGVDLQFTPHINANGVIRLEINLSISSVGAEVSSANSQPSISNNTLSTEIIVRDNQTIVMGGMISDSEQWGKESVPFLGRIPLLKHLFTNRDSSSSKAELIVLITPRLIDSEEKSIEISKEFKEKILAEFESFRDSKD